MEVSHVRNRLRLSIDAARERAQLRRERTAAAERSFASFLDTATALLRQLANALKVEGYGFTVFTPEGALRLASERSRDDFVELALDTSGERPEVMARISFTRGSRTVDEERPVKAGAAPDAITDTELLDFLLDALEPWLERR